MHERMHEAALLCVGMRPVRCSSTMLGWEEREDGIFCDFVERKIDVPWNALGLFETCASLFEHGAELQAGVEDRLERRRGNGVSVVVT